MRPAQDECLFLDIYWDGKGNETDTVDQMHVSQVHAELLHMHDPCRWWRGGGGGTQRLKRYNKKQAHLTDLLWGKHEEFNYIFPKELAWSLLNENGVPQLQKQEKGLPHSQLEVDEDLQQIYWGSICSKLFTICFLLQKLKLYRCDPSTVNWFSSYFGNWMWRVNVRNTLSQPQPITMGVPHGSILGPLLFLIQINETCPIWSRISNTTVCQWYHHSSSWYGTQNCTE